MRETINAEDGQKSRPEDIMIQESPSRIKAMARKRRAELKAEEELLAQKKAHEMKLAEKEEARRIREKKRRAKEALSAEERVAERFYIVYRIFAIISVVLVFFPSASPTRICTMINRNISLFTSAVSYGSLTAEMGRAFDKGWIMQWAIIVLYIASILLMLGIIASAACACMSLGNVKLKKKGNPIGAIGACGMLAGLALILVAYNSVSGTTKADKVGPMFPTGFFIYACCAVVLLVFAVLQMICFRKITKEQIAEMKYEMDPTYKLFLLFLPFAFLCFVFSYLPLMGWRYAFFNYSAGQTLSADNFVGFKWFTSLFSSDATKADVVRVLRNTLIMSGLGIVTSWCPMAFAIFLNEIKNAKFKRFVQTFTTIPNFISWVLVYAVALSIFSTDGFINTLLAKTVGGIHDTNYLMGSSMIWLKMLLWGMWKGIGWSAIIYIAGISGIDQSLYEAATMDGAGRFQRMWHITVPGLLPTYFVMLLMSIANILSNGMDQYLVFQNAQNTKVIEVLDLYVYTLGIQNGNIPLSTVIGMVKSLISVILLFSANGISKAIRGESIV